MKVDSIIIQGNKRVHTHVIESEFRNARLTNDSDEIFDAIRNADSCLKKYNIFEKVETTVEFLEDTQNIEQQKISIEVNVEEKGIPYLSVSGDVRTQHGVIGDFGGDIKAGLRSPFGYGEMMSGMYGKGAIGGSNDWKFNCTLPNLKHFLYKPLLSKKANIKEVSDKTVEETSGTTREASNAPVTVTAPKTPTETNVNAKSWISPMTNIPWVNACIEHLCDGAITFDVSANTENSFNRNGLNYYLQGVNMGWSSMDMKHRLNLEWMKRDCLSPAIPELDQGMETEPNMNVWGSGHGSGRDVGRYRHGQFHWIPYDILLQAYPSTKSALKYQYVAMDTRDSRVIPSSGSFLDMALEIAGLMGSSIEPFIKSEITYQKHVNFSDMLKKCWSTNQRQPVHSISDLPPTKESWFSVPSHVPGIIGSFCLNYGLILPLQSKECMHNAQTNTNSCTTGDDPHHHSSSVCLIDRFYIGGPFSLRGFDYFSVDKQSKYPLHQLNAKPYRNINNKKDIESNAYDIQQIGQALGGLSKLTCLSALSFPIPITELAKNDLRGMLFLNMGCLGNGLTYCRNNMQLNSMNVLTNCFGSPRVSIGSGIVWNFASQARLELTYSIPILANSSDKLKGFQFGFGLTIM